MSTVTSSTNPTAAASAASTGATATTAKEASERFLKLLVTQLQNQDPMNPVDNAQMTSQMAQISTVSGIEKLNTTVEAMTGQFVQMQMLQGASLVGREVLVASDRLTESDGGLGGSFALGSAADSVKVEVLSKNGSVVDTLTLGKQTSGRHDFDWPGGAGKSASDGYRFRISASSGSTALSATPLARDTVNAVSANGSSLTLELKQGGSVPYTDVQSVG